MYRSKTDKDGKPVEKEGKKEKEGIWQYFSENCI